MIEKCPICGKECVDTGTGLIGCTNRSCGYQVSAKRRAEHSRASRLTWGAVDDARYAASYEELDALERGIGFVRDSDGGGHFTLLCPSLTERGKLGLLNVINRVRTLKERVDRTDPKSSKEEPHA